MHWEKEIVKNLVIVDFINLNNNKMCLIFSLLKFEQTASGKFKVPGTLITGSIEMSEMFTEMLNFEIYMKL